MVGVSAGNEQRNTFCEMNTFGFWLGFALYLISLLGVIHAVKRTCEKINPDEMGF